MKNSGFDYLIDPSTHCFFIKHYGVFNLEIVGEGNKALMSHKDYKWDLNRLVDLTKCELDLTTDDVRTLSNAVTARNSADSQYRGAYIVNSALAHGMLRIFETLVQSPVNDYQIYNSDTPKLENQVKTWLGLSDTYLLPDFI